MRVLALAICGYVAALQPARIAPRQSLAVRQAPRGVHQRVLDELRTFVDDETPLEWVAKTASPLTGPAGNKEFLVLLKK